MEPHGSLFKYLKEEGLFYGGPEGRPHWWKLQKVEFLGHLFNTTKLMNLNPSLSPSDSLD